MAEDRDIRLCLAECQEDGLYLFFDDADALRLTRVKIEEFSRRLWDDDGGLPAEMREAVEFRRCPICPQVEQAGFCEAVLPPLTFVQEVDRYVSFDRVIAVYRGRDDPVLHVSLTTMQQALRYVAFMSLLSYCSNGRKYWRYFNGVVPLMDSRELANRVYLNIYWLHRGDRQQIAAFIQQFKRELLLTMKHQITRLSLVCANDAFMNAYANTQAAIEYLAMDIERRLEESFRKFVGA